MWLFLSFEDCSTWSELFEPFATHLSVFSGIPMLPNRASQRTLTVPFFTFQTPHTFSLQLSICTGLNLLCIPCSWLYIHNSEAKEKESVLHSFGQKIHLHALSRVVESKVKNYSRFCHTKCQIGVQEVKAILFPVYCLSNQVSTSNINTPSVYVCLRCCCSNFPCNILWCSSDVCRGDSGWAQHKQSLTPIPSQHLQRPIHNLISLSYLVFR